MRPARKPITVELLEKMWEQAAEDYNAALDAGDDISAERHAYREAQISELLNNLKEGAPA